MEKLLKIYFFRESKNKELHLMTPCMIFSQEDIADYIMPTETNFVAVPGVSGKVKDFDRIANVSFTTIIWIDSYFCSDFEPSRIVNQMQQNGWKLESSNLKA